MRRQFWRDTKPLCLPVIPRAAEAKIASVAPEAEPKARQKIYKHRRAHQVSRYLNQFLAVIPRADAKMRASELNPTANHAKPEKQRRPHHGPACINQFLVVVPHDAEAKKAAYVGPKVDSTAKEEKFGKHRTAQH